LDDSGCIYRSAKLNQVPWQLWANGVLLTPARWPNARFSDYSIFDGNSPNGSFAYSSSRSTSGELHDNGHHKPSLADSGIDMTDTIIVIPFGTMGNRASGAPVTDHKAHSDIVKYIPPAGTAGHGHSNIPYFFEGHPKLLDSAEEWVYDKKNGQLLMWLPNCADPNKQPSGFLRGKIREFNINMTQSIVGLQRLTLFGTTYAATSSTLILDTVQMLYPTFNKRSIGDPSPVVETYMRSMNNFVVVNCTISFADTVSLFNVVPDLSRIVNNLFHANGYSSGVTATIDDKGFSRGLIFKRNTVEYFNTFSAITPSFDSNVSLNIFRFQGVNADGACIHVHIGPQNGIFLSHNWAYDTVVKAFRFDRVNKPNATWGINGTVSYNVAWRTGPLMIKGDKHTVVNNTIFNSNDRNRALWVMEYDSRIHWSIPGENAHTVMENNGADSIFNVSGKLPGLHENNLGNTCIEEQLRSPSQFNFLPKPGSILDKNGIGAYRNGETTYWIPGRQGHGATMPIPSNGAIDVSTNVQLIWLEAYRAISHQIYFGSNIKLLKPINMYDLGINVHQLVDLQPNMTYYWRVDAIHNFEIVQPGEVWSFQTESQ